MNMQENARLILGLRAKGWTDTEIADFLLYIASGDEQYKPTPNQKESSFCTAFCSSVRIPASGLQTYHRNRRSKEKISNS